MRSVRHKEILERGRIGNLINTAGNNYVQRYTDHLNLSERLSILEAARQTTLEPKLTNRNGQIQLKKINSRSLAAVVYVQKFRTFAWRFCSNFNINQPSSIHSELNLRFSKLPIKEFLSDQDASLILQFLLQGCCPTLINVKLIEAPYQHRSKAVVKAVKKLRNALDVSESKACSKCPQRIHCPWTRLGLTKPPRLVHLIRILCGMHLTCLSYLRAAEIRLRFNPFEMQGYLKLIDATERSIEKFHPEMLLKDRHLRNRQSLKQIQKLEAKIEKIRKFNESRMQNHSILNIPSWMRPSIDPTDEKKLTRRQRRLLKLFRRMQEEDATPEGFVDDATGRVIVNEQTMNRITLQSIQSKRKKGSKKTKCGREEDSDEELVWVPEPDSMKTEFGAPINQVEDKMSDEDFESKFEEASKESEKQRQTYFAETTNDNMIIFDIDEISNEFLNNDKKNDKKEVIKRFNYLMDFRGDARGASSVQQALYQNYLKAIKLAVPKAKKIYHIDINNASSTPPESLSQLRRALNHEDLNNHIKAAESFSEIVALAETGYSMLESSSCGPLTIVQHRNVEVLTKYQRCSLDLGIGSKQTTQRALISKIWDRVPCLNGESQDELSCIRKFDFDYPKQSSSGLQPMIIERVLSTNEDKRAGYQERRSEDEKPERKARKNEKENYREKCNADQNWNENEGDKIDDVKKVKKRRHSWYLSNCDQADQEIDVDAEELSKLDSAIRLHQEQDLNIDAQKRENDDVEEKIRRRFKEVPAPVSIEELRSEGFDSQWTSGHATEILSNSKAQCDINRMSRYQRKEARRTKAQLLNNDELNDCLFEQWKKNNLKNAGGGEDPAISNVEDTDYARMDRENFDRKWCLSKQSDDYFKSVDGIKLVKNQIDHISESTNKLNINSKLPQSTLGKGVNRHADSSLQETLGFSESSQKMKYVKGRDHSKPDPLFEKVFRRPLEFEGSGNKMLPKSTELNLPNPITNRLRSSNFRNITKCYSSTNSLEWITPTSAKDSTIHESQTLISKLPRTQRQTQEERQAQVDSIQSFFSR